jgi:hypothetical protein
MGDMVDSGKGEGVMRRRGGRGRQLRGLGESVGRPGGVQGSWECAKKGLAVVRG